MPGRMFAVSGPGNGLTDDYIDAIAAALDKSRRPATLRAYERAWERFRVWAVSKGLEPLPADPLTVAAYLTYRAGIGRSAVHPGAGPQGDQLPPRQARISVAHGVRGGQGHTGRTPQPGRGGGPGRPQAGPRADRDRAAGDRADRAPAAAGPHGPHGIG